MWKSLWKWIESILHVDFLNRPSSASVDPLGRKYDSQEYEGVFGTGTSFESLLKNLFGKFAGTSLTGAARESSELQLQNQRILNQEDFDRKVDFYERYESPQAMMRQYQEAGLNPALMYSGAPSISASGGVGTGSAAAPQLSSESLAGLVSALSGISLKTRQMNMDRELRDRELDIEEQKVGIQRDMADADIGLKIRQSTFQDIHNRWADKIFDLDTKNVQAKIDTLVDQLKTNEVQRELYKSDISFNYAKKALTDVQTAIAGCDLKVRERYNSIMLRLSELQAQQMGTYNSYQGRLLQAEYNRTFQDGLNLMEQHNLLQAESGIRWKDYQFYESNRNWDHGLAVGRAALTAGAAAGAALISRGKFAPASSIQTPTGAQYMHFNPHPYTGPIIMQ